jgi:subtilisin family serine protease
VQEEKFALSTNVFTQKSLLPKNTSLIAVIDEECVLANTPFAGEISQQFKSQIENRGSPLDRYAYSFKAPSTYSLAQMQNKVNTDPCLIQLSEDAEVTTSYTPNDSQYGNQLHLTAINAPTAWDTLYSGLTGQTTIAIIDDGMEMTHSDLSGVLWTNPGEIASNGVDDDGNGFIDDVNGYNFASSLASPAHQNGATHGTHVAGLAAAQGNNSIGVSGVMGTNAKIMVLNVFGTAATASSANIINAINYARNKGAHVINMSLGGAGTSASTNVAMVNAVAAGTFIAVAAGNDNALVSSGNPYTPMGYAKDIEGAIAVGSLDATTLARSSFSNYSTSYVEIAAPGSNAATGGVLATYPPNTYNYLQGTSMASPVVAGAAALLSGWARARGNTITPSQIEAILKASADSRSGLTSFFQGGYSLNMANMSTAAQCYLP